MKSLTFGRGKKAEFTQVTTSDLRALLFWAAVGVNGSVGGSFEGDIENIISSYADHLGMHVNNDFCNSNDTHQPATFMTSEQFMAKKLGQKGGKARAAKLTPQRRLEISKLANKAKSSKLK